MNIIRFKDIFSEEYDLIQCENIYEVFEEEKEYLVLINDNEFYHPKDKLECMENDIVSVRELPKGSTGSKLVDGIIGGLAVIGGAVLGIVGAFAGASFLGFSLMGIGVTMLGGLTGNGEVKQKSDLGKAFGFGKGENQVLVDAPFPIVLGKHRVTPPIVGNFKTFQDQANNIGFNPAYIEGLLCLGYGKIFATDIKLGEDILFKGNADSEFKEIEPNGDYTLELTHGKLPSIYCRKITEESVGIELKCGLIRAWLKNNTPAQLPQVVGNVSYLTQAHNQDAQRPIPAGCKKVTINICFANGLYGWVGDRGQYIALPQSILYKFHKAGEVPKLEEMDSFVYSSLWNAQLKIAKDIDVPEGDGWELTLKKGYFIENRYVPNTEALPIYEDFYDYWSDDGSRANYKKGSTHAVNPTITSLQYHFDEAPVKPEITKRMTFLAFRILAKQDRNTSLKSINLLADSKQSNPARIALDILRGKFSSRSVSEENIDYEAFNEVAELLDNKVHCNALITEQMTMINLVENVLAIANAGVILVGSKYSVVQDRVEPFPLTILTPKNTSDFQSNISTDKKPKAIRVNFFNSEKNYVKDQLEFRAKKGVEIKDEDIIEVTPFGIVTKAEAKRFAKYILSVNEYRNEVFTCTVPLYHYYLPVGSRVLVQQDILLVGITSGKVLNFENNVVTLDEEIETDESKTYGICVAVDINVVKNIKVTPTDKKNQFVCSTDSNIKGKIYAFGEFGNETFDCVIKSKSKISTPNLSATFELVRYDERIFNEDDSDIEEYHVNTTLPSSNTVTEVYKPSEKPNISDNIFSVDDEGNLLINNAPIHSVTDKEPPTDIDSVTVQGYTNGDVKISWVATNDNVGGSGLAGYKVYRSEHSDKSGKIVIGETGTKDTTYNDTTTALNKTYYYGASAYDRNNNVSGITWSDAIVSSYKIAPNTPTSVVAKAYHGYIGLTWDAPTNASDVTYYEIYKNEVYLARSGTPSFNEEIGKIEFDGAISTWNYKVRAYNVNGVYGNFSTAVSVLRNGYGTFIKKTLKPQLTSVINSITVAWEKQHELMDFKEVEIAYGKNNVFTTYVRTPTFYSINNLEFNKDSIGNPIATAFCVAIRQIAMDGSTNEWSTGSWSEAPDRALATIYPADKSIARYEQLDALSINSGAVNSNVIKGSPKNASIAATERYATDDTTLNYIDLTTGRFRLGDVNAYIYGNIQPQGSSIKSSILFKSLDLELSTSDLVTNADNIKFKHTGRSLVWLNSSNQQIAKISADSSIMSIANNVLVAGVIHATSLVQGAASNQYYTHWFGSSGSVGLFKKYNTYNMPDAPLGGWFSYYLNFWENDFGDGTCVIKQVVLPVDNNPTNKMFVRSFIPKFDSDWGGWHSTVMADWNLYVKGINNLLVNKNISCETLNTSSSITSGQTITCQTLNATSSISISYPNRLNVRHIEGASSGDLFLNYTSRASIHLYGNTYTTGFLNVAGNLSVAGSISSSSIRNLSNFNTSAVRGFSTPAELNGYVAPSSGILILHYIKINNGIIVINVNGLQMLYYLSYTTGEKYTDKFYLNKGDVIHASGNQHFNAYFHATI